MKIVNVEQGSQEWLSLRAGKITMSRAKEFASKGRGSLPSKTRESAILDCVTERLSGEPLESYFNLDMERGTFLEEWAGQAFTHATGIKIDLIGFVLHDDERIGYSPDGFTSDGGVIEIKCPKPRQHIRNIYSDGIDQYRAQIQGGMWITDKPHAYIVTFCPWVTQYPLFIKRINRDQPMIDTIEQACISAADEVDSLVDKAQQDRKITDAISDISNAARDAWENVLADNSEVTI